MKNTKTVHPLVLLLTISAFVACSLLAGCNPYVSTSSIGILGDDQDKEKKDDVENAWGADQVDGKHLDENDLLKDLEKPLFALFVTGRQHGYIEPCGCTGLFNQKGGLMRRHRVQQLLEKLGWDLIPIDAGNQIRRFGQQPIIKLHHTWDGLSNVMKYAAIGLGPDDLKTPTIDLVQTLSNVVSDSNPIVSANVNLMGADLQKPFVVVEKGGKKIGITQAIDDKIVDSLKNNEELELKSLGDALKQVARNFNTAGCDLKVLMLQTEEVETAKQVATQFPYFDLLIHTTSAGEPEKLPTKVQSGDHTTSMIQIGTKGMYVGAVACYEKDGKLEMNYERIPLDGRFTDTKPMEKVFENYQAQLKNLFVTDNLMDVKPKPHPSGYKFVGSQACFDCHQDEFEIWEDGVDGNGGPHFIATDSIVTPPNNRGHIPRHHDPECLSCHVTGWHPQNYYPYETGFINLKQGAHLTGNGCENCHGPGSEHVKIEQADDKGRQVDKNQLKDIRRAMRLTMKEARNGHCVQCHDADNSPDFLKDGAFDKYWARIKH